MAALVLSASGQTVKLFIDWIALAIGVVAAAVAIMVHGMMNRPACRSALEQRLKPSRRRVERWAGGGVRAFLECLRTLDPRMSLVKAAGLCQTCGYAAARAASGVFES